MRHLVLYSVFGFGASLAVAASPYFPVKEKDGGTGISAFRAEWYSKALERMKEPKLPSAAKDPNAEIYRFTILPTWGNPIAVRLERTGDIYSLSSRRLDGEGGYDPGKLVEKEDVKLTGAETKIFESLLKSLKFFEMRTDESEKTAGADGEEWILEGVSEGKYHTIHRWSADYDTKKRGLEPLMKLCRFLIDQSKLSERPKNLGRELLPAK